nr:immunoglobulin heavy chain junction region [Mus musculus]MBK4185084.1 immunoglobulin heavy chain junction region [Mus musculus]
CTGPYYYGSSYGFDYW